MVWWMMWVGGEVQETGDGHEAIPGDPLCDREVVEHGVMVPIKMSLWQPVDPHQ